MPYARLVKSILAIALPLAAAATLVTPSLSGFAHAEDKDRFTLMRDGDDLVRMDNRTGQMSICSNRNGDLVCRMAADDREAVEKELDALLDRIDQLEARRDNGDEDYHLDDEDFAQFERDLDKILGYSTRTIKRFHGAMKGLQRELYD